MLTERQLDIWGENLATKIEEKDTMQIRHYRRFLKNLVYRVNNNLDAITAVCGERGFGKSSTSIASALVLRHYGLSFSFDNIYFGLDSLRDAVTKISTKEKGVYCFDEIVEMAYSREAMTKTNRFMKKFFTKVRKRNNVIFFNIPRFKDMDSSLRNGVINYWMEVFWKSKDEERSKRFAMAAFFRKNRNPFVSDPWDLDNIKLHKYTAYNASQQRKIMKRSTSFIAMMSIPILPKVIEDEYERIAYEYLGKSEEQFDAIFSKDLQKGE